MNAMDTLPAEGALSPRERQGLPSYLTAIGGVTSYPEANIASVLKKLLPESPPRGSRAFIVGGDGQNVHQEDYRMWRELIRTRLKAGCNDEYLLVSADTHEAAKTLRGILEECRREGSSGNLCVYQLRPIATDPISAELFDELETKHFLLVDNPRCIWYEGCHPKKSTQATDCYFFDERASQESELWDVFMSKFELARNHSSKIG